MTSKIGVVNEWMNSFVCINMYDCTLKLSVYFVFQQFVTSLMPVITLEAINSGWLYLKTQANIFNKTQTCRWFYSHYDRFLVCNYLFAICQWIQLTPTRSKNQYRSFKSNKSFFLCCTLIWWCCNLQVHLPLITREPLFTATISIIPFHWMKFQLVDVVRDNKHNIHDPIFITNTLDSLVAQY